MNRLTIVVLALIFKLPYTTTGQKKSKFKTYTIEQFYKKKNITDFDKKFCRA